MTITAIQALVSVKESAEKIQSDKPQRFPEAASTGDYFRQGDIYVTRLESVPEIAELDRKPSLQLAPGTTKGSRHVIDSKVGVEVYRLSDADVLTGPVVKFDCERVITHPEHGDIICPPGVYGVTYQRAYAEVLRRAMD